MTLPRGDSRHGTANAYNYHGCRCDICRSGWAVYIMERNHRLGYHRPRAEYFESLRTAPHGTESRYRRASDPCRCDECRRASSEARARRRAKAAP